MGISSVEVSFSNSNNESSAANSVLYINAYNSANTRLSVSFDTSNGDSD